MKQILLVDILAILRNNETIYLYESPNHSVLIDCLPISVMQRY